MGHATWMYKSVDGTLTPRLFEAHEEIPEGWHDNPASAMEPIISRSAPHITSIKARNTYDPSKHM